MTTTRAPSQPYRILSRENDARSWKQFLVITRGRVALVEMSPALCGWNYGRVTIQTSADWGDMSADAIVAWKLRNDDGLTSAPTIPERDVARLLELAGLCAAA